MSKIFVKRNALLLTLYLFCINDSLKSTNVAISYGISVDKSRIFGKINATFRLHNLNFLLFVDTFAEMCHVTFCDFYTLKNTQLFLKLGGFQTNFLK